LSLPTMNSSSSVEAASNLSSLGGLSILRKL
jgi:hypothetical protein